MRNDRPSRCLPAVLAAVLAAPGVWPVAGALVAATTPSALAAAADEKRAAGYYEDAVKRYKAGEYEAAIIQIKNALQQSPKLLAAMALMGEIYVATGDGAAAETALKEATKAGADTALTAVPLARAYLLQFKHGELLALPVPADLPLLKRAELLEVKAAAAVQVNDRRALEEILAEVDRIDPKSVAALSIRATIALREARFDEAAELVGTATRIAPDNPLVWLTRASLNHAQDRGEEALRDYDRILAADPGNADARLARVGLLLDLGRADETDDDFARLARANKVDPRLQYLRALKLSRAGDAHGARSALNETANTIETIGRAVVNRNLQLLLIAGAVNFQLGNTAAARDYLEHYVQSAGGEIETRKMLATTLLQAKEFGKAAKLIEQIIESDGESPELLAMLARAYTGAEKHHRATAALERAAALQPENPVLATNLAMSWARRGEVDTALGELTEVFEASNGDPLAGLNLAVLHLNRGDYPAAERVARELYARQPENLTIVNLLGITLTGQERHAEARTLFEKALALDPDYRPASLNLGKLDRRDGRFPEAERRFNELLAERPEDAQLMLELARTFAARGDRKTALKWAGDAAKLQPTSFEIARLIIDLHLQDKAFAKARDVAWQQAQHHPDNLFVMESQARILLAEDQLDDARPILKRMVDEAQFNTDWLLRTARLQLLAGHASDAQYALYKAVQGSPESVEARVLLGEVELRLGNFAAAEDIARRLAEEAAEEPSAHTLMGEVLMARGEPAAAAAEFHRAVELAGKTRPDIALRYHLALRAAGEHGAAGRFLRTWLEAEPAAHWARGALAEHLIHTGDYSEAATMLKAFDAEVPNHAPTLNNLANVLLKLRDVPGALDYARRAHALQPEDPLINDTLGWVLVQAEQPGEALRYLREAHTRAATVPEIRYHLAVALLHEGREQEARAELEAALQASGPFDGKADAEQLRATLGG